MKQLPKGKMLRVAVIPAAIIAVAIVASSWSSGGLAEKQADRARAPLPVPILRIDERASNALRAAMPALQSLAFESNIGQSSASVKFLARGGANELLLSSNSFAIRSSRGSFNISFPGAEVANINICRYVGAGQVTYMFQPVGIRKG